MTKILTAIKDEKILNFILRNKITEEKNILYKEAIIDVLSNNKNIDILIISENIPGEINLIKLIKKIKKINKKIKIIMILSNKKIEKELIKNNIKDIYYNNLYSIYKLIKKLKKNKTKNRYLIKNNENKLIIRKRISKIKCNGLKKQNIKNNIICLFGNNQIDKKIIKLIIIKNLININKKIILINLKINNKKQINKKLNKINNIKKIKNKYYIKVNYKIKEKIIKNNIKEITNISQILKNKNYLEKRKILKEVIRKYSKNNGYVIVNNNYNIKDGKNILLRNKYINIFILENNKNNLQYLNLINNINNNKKKYLLLINYKKNNLSKYFYITLLKNRYWKIKIINYY